jgi:two-component sensor histidine kinase
MWAVTNGPGPALLLVEWTESGGPLARKPERQGFGTKLIQRGLAQQLGGDIKLDFPSSGVRYVITFPIESVAISSETVDGSEKRFTS